MFQNNPQLRIGIFLPLPSALEEMARIAEKDYPNPWKTFKSIIIEVFKIIF